MDILKTFIVPDLQSVPSTIKAFVQQYDAPRALNAPQDATEIKIVQDIVLTINNIVNTYTPSKLHLWNSTTLHLEDINTLCSLFNLLKIVSRFGLDNMGDCYKIKTIENYFKIYQQAILISTTIMTNPTNSAASHKPEDALNSLICLRCETSRVLQNLAILSASKFANVFADEDLIETLFTVLRDSIFNHFGINADIIQKSLLANSETLSISQLIGLQDLGHMLRCVVHLLTADTDLCLVKAGLLAELYKIFFKISNLKLLTLEQLNDTTYTVPSNVGLYCPMLLDPRGIQMDFFKELNVEVLSTEANNRDKLYIQFRTIINDLSRIFIVYGALGSSESDEHESYIAINCNGSSEGDEVKLLSNLTIFQTFTQRALVMLGAGISIEQVPEPINRPITQILTHEDILKCYYTPGSPLQYDQKQEDILVEYAQSLKSPQAQGILDKFNDAVIPDGTTVQFDGNPVGLSAVKTSLAKMLGRFPLQYCPFLIVHRYSLTYIWALFNGCINMLAPVPPEGGFTPEQTTKMAKAVQDTEYTEILPIIELLLKILTSAAQMEAVSAENMTREKALYYANLGIGPLAWVVKALLFGKYADREVDEANRAIVLEKMIKEGEAEEEMQHLEEQEKLKKAFETLGLGSDDEVPDEAVQAADDDDEECDDFEMFAAESMDPELKKKNNQKMNVKEFLATLPPQKRTYNTQMIAAGGVTESLLDDENNHSLKARVLILLLSPHYRIAALLQELVFKIASEQSDEYIRLCGFGRAVGLLTGKGLPGFAHLAQNSINLDSFMGGK